MIIALEEAKSNIEELRISLDELYEALKIEQLNKEKEELNSIQQEPNLYLDVKRSNDINRKLKQVEAQLNRYYALENRINDTLVMVELCIEAEDSSEIDAIKSELLSINEDIDSLKIVTLLKGKYDANNAILTLHAGAGGTEAQDWCQMLYRMYVRYCERQGYEVKELDMLAGDEAGIKSVTFMVSGDNAYGYLKCEKGVHRLVRISPFDSNKRRHTSFASLEVMPEIINDDEIVIKPEEIRVDTYRSSGAGGQHVNKTESAIRITHIASGIVVACQNERSQIQNRETAMKMLMSKLIEKRERENYENVQSIKGELKKIEWGSQIRSYVFCPYTLVKDHRSGFENSNVQAVMDGDIHPFIIDYLKKI